MAGISLLGHKCSGHSCYPPRPTVASPIYSVMVNDQVPIGFGALLAVHACATAHPSTVCGHSSTVTFNDIPVSRIGDAVCCGGVLTGFSKDTYAGG